MRFEEAARLVRAPSKEFPRAADVRAVSWTFPLRAMHAPRRKPISSMRPSPLAAQGAIALALGCAPAARPAIDERQSIVTLWRLMTFAPRRDATPRCSVSEVLREFGRGRRQALAEPKSWRGRHLTHAGPPRYQ